MNMITTKTIIIEIDNDAVSFSNFIFYYSFLFHLQRYQLRYVSLPDWFFNTLLPVSQSFQRWKNRSSFWILWPKVMKMERVPPELLQTMLFRLEACSLMISSNTRRILFFFDFLSSQIVRHRKYRPSFWILGRKGMTLECVPPELLEIRYSLLWKHFCCWFHHVSTQAKFLVSQPLRSLYVSNFCRSWISY